MTVRTNCKRLILRYRAGEGVLTLTVPKGVGKKAVEAFLADKLEWIQHHMQEVETWQPAYAAGEKHLLFGEYVTLGENGVPTGQKAFEQWRAARLAEYIRPVIEAWETRLGVRCAGVRLRDMTSRWGSCQTVTGMITLNLRLARVPHACVDYVIAHEVCHLLHLNHSKAFHQTMTLHMPDWHSCKQQLNSADLRARKE